MFRILKGKQSFLSHGAPMFFDERKLSTGLVKVMDKIKTFVFMDMETTGLPHEEYNKTKVTEICFISVQSEHIQCGVYPRVLNKLNLCFNPQKMVHPEATSITGLANDMLEHQPTFRSEAGNTILGFLNLFKKPICLVAHNGNNFDFPIFKAEMTKANTCFPNDILCLDSLTCFRTLETQDSVLETDNTVSEREEPIEFSDNYDAILCSVVDQYEECSRVKTTRTEMQRINETTPKKPICTHGGIAKRKPKKLFNEGRKKVYMSFKLGDIYKRLTSLDAKNAHNAEGDVETMIHCAAVYGEKFVDWANLNATPFSNIPAMTPGKKIGT